MTPRALAEAAYFKPERESVFAHLRRDRPVYHDEELDVWVVSRHADVTFALRHPELLASRFGVMPDEHGRPDRLAGRTLEGSEFLLYTDPPLHDELRRVVQPGFSQSAFSAWEVGVREYISSTLDAIPDAEPVDIVGQLARPVSLRSIADFVGVDRSDADWIGGAADTWEPPHLRPARQGGRVGGETLEEYFARVLAERVQSPRDDLLGLIAKADDPRLTLETKLMLCIDIFIAGDQPTAAAISGGVHALIEHPEQLDALVADPSLIATAADEILRWVSPVIVMCRTAIDEVVIDGNLIPAGAYVYLVLGSANRDEATWAEAGCFDVSRRDASRHVTFGKGIHACIGAGLVRRALRIFLEEFVARFDRAEAAGDIEFASEVPPQLPRLSRLPVVLHRR